MRNAPMIAANKMIENIHDHWASLMVHVSVVYVIFSCLSAFPLAGKSESATSNHTISIPKAIQKGRTRLILVKKGSATIKKILTKETRPLIEEDIFLNYFSFPIFVRVSWRNAEVFPVEKASVPKDISTDQTRKYQNPHQMTNIILQSTRHILAITIVVLFPNLSQIIPAGI